MLTTWVYLHHAADGSVLYVGCTQNLRRRSREHLRSSRWCEQIDRIEVDGHYENMQALRREGELIRLHEPPFNIRGNPPVERESAAWQRLARNVGVFEASRRSSGRTATEAWEDYCHENSRGLLDEVRRLEQSRSGS